MKPVALTLLIAGVTASVLGGVYLLLAPGEEAVKPPPLPKSDPIFTTAPPPIPPVRTGKLSLSKSSLAFGQVEIAAGATASFTILTEGFPGEIKEAEILYGDENGIRLETDCVDKQIPPGQGCQIGLRWQPTKAGRLPDLEVRILGEIANSSGAVETLTLTLPISGEARAPVPPPQIQPVPPYATLAALAARQRDLLDQRILPQGKLPGDGQDRDWAEIGVAQTKSSLPVDMTRIITIDKVITATLLFPIDSRQSGRAIAIVNRDVYGGESRVVLLPRGSKLIGEAQANQEKIAIAWTDLIRPDGVRFRFDAVSGDAMGRMGVPGYRDNRWLERFGNLLLGSLVSAGATYAIGGESDTTLESDGQTTTTGDAKSRAAEQLRQDFKSLFDQMLEERLGLQPILEVPAGTRLTVFPTTDLFLKSPDEESLESAPSAVAKSESTDTPALPKIHVDEYGRSVDEKGNLVDPETGDILLPAAAMTQPNYLGNSSSGNAAPNSQNAGNSGSPIVVPTPPDPNAIEDLLP